MKPSQQAILEIKNLTKVFKSDLLKKSQIAVKDLSCRFLKGKCTGLLGHNGAGKTTTIRIIFGLIRPNAGEILFNGKKIETKDKVHIGYMPEVSKLPENLSCIEIIKIHLANFLPQLSSEERMKRVESALQEVGLWDVRNKRVKSLSKGMGRRLAWAQATVHDPDLVILDEPFSGLDPVACHDLLTWVKNFKRSGKSLILCTHDLWSVRELCDEVHVFKKGELSYSTLDVAKHTRTAALNSSIYQLVITGVKVTDLKSIGDQHRLKPWEYVTQKDLIIRLAFKEYEVASAWLRACLDRGLIVLRFADEIAVEDDSIKALFEGGQLV